MVPGFAELAPVHDENRVHVLDGREPVCDGEHGPAGHEDVQGVLNEALGVGVDTGGCFVQDEDARRDGEGSREREELLLTDRQRRAPFGNRRLVAFRQPLDEPIRVHRPGGRANLVVIDVLVAESDVAGDRSGKQVDVLEHEPEQAPQ